MQAWPRGVAMASRRHRFERLLAAMALAGAVLLWPGAGQAAARADPRPPLMVDLEVGLAGLMSLTELEFQKMSEALQQVAMSDVAASAQWERIEPLLRWVRDRNMPALVWFALPDGSYWSVDGGKAEGNLSRRDYFPRVLAGQLILGELVVSYATGRSSGIVAVPVRRDGETVGVLGASVFLDAFSEELRSRLGLRPPLIFFALDSEPLLALDWMSEVFENPKQLGSPSLARAVNQMLAGEEGRVRYEYQGRQRVVLYRKSKVLPWWFALGVLRDDGGR